MPAAVRRGQSARRAGCELRLTPHRRVPLRCRPRRRIRRRHRRYSAGAGTPSPVPAVGDVTPSPAPTGPAVVTADHAPAARRRADHSRRDARGRGLRLAPLGGSALVRRHPRRAIDRRRPRRASFVAAVDSVRIRQIGTTDAPVVRIALTLRGEKQVDIEPAADGLTIAASNVDAIAACETGSGRIGSAAIGDANALPSLLAGRAGNAGRLRARPRAVEIRRRFAHDRARSGSRRRRLRHRAQRSGREDADHRHRAPAAHRCSLSAGWTVRMTRDSDIDPVSQANLTAMRADGNPIPSDRAYLQTR